jgi:hypothetical protein
MISLHRTYGAPKRHVSTGARIAAALLAALVAAGICAAGSTSLSAQEAGPAVTIGSTVPDQAAGTVTLGEIRIAYPGDKGTTITIDKVVLKGTTPSADEFKASEVGIEGLTTTYAVGAKISVLVDKATLRDVSAPMPSAGKLSAAGKAGKIPPLAEWLLAAKARSILIPSLTFKTDVEGITSDLVYKDIALQGLVAGAIANLTVASAAQTTAGGSPKTASTVHFGKMAIEGIDFGAYAAWLDDSLAAAAPQEKRLVYKSFSVDGLSAVTGEGTFSMERLAGGDVKIGPPRMKPSDFMTLIGKMQADPNFAEKSPQEVVTFLKGVLGAFEIGNFQMTGLKFGETGKPPATIGLMRVENFAGSRIGEIRLGNMAFTDERDGTSLNLGSFAIRGFDIVDIELMLDRIAQGQSPDSLTPQQFPKPRITGIALADLDVTVPGKGKFTIGGITLDTPDWVGFSPVTVKGRIEGFSMPVDAIEEANSRDQFKALGLDNLTINSAVDLAWKESDETMALGPVTLDIDGVGEAAVSGAVGGVPKSVFENPQTAEQAIATLDFRGLTVSLQDGGAFAKLIETAAKEQGMTRDALAQQTAQQIQGGMIALLGMEDAAKTISTAVKAFMENPKSLKVVIGVLEPIPAIAFMKVSEGDRDALSAIKKSVKIEASANE